MRSLVDIVILETKKQYAAALYYLFLYYFPFSSALNPLITRVLLFWSNHSPIQPIYKLG